MRLYRTVVIFSLIPRFIEPLGAFLFYSFCGGKVHNAGFMTPPPSDLLSSGQQQRTQGTTLDKSLWPGRGLPVERENHLETEGRSDHIYIVVYYKRFGKGEKRRLVVNFGDILKCLISAPNFEC